MEGMQNHGYLTDQISAGRVKVDNWWGGKSQCSRNYANGSFFLSDSIRIRL